LQHGQFVARNGHSQENTGQQLQNAGLYIGWLERFLVQSG